MLRTFHLAMITYLCVFVGIFIVACGYKSTPFYDNAASKPQQGDSQSLQPQSIQSIDSKVVTGGEGD